MDKRNFYYGQLVTEDDLNGAFDSVERTELNLAKELHETGILVGLDVSPTSPPSTAVEVTAGAARIPSTGQRAVIDGSTTPTITVAMDTDKFGNPVYSDLLSGEGRWAAVYIAYRRDQYDARIDDNGITVWYRQDDSYELFVLIANKGNASDKDTLPRPPILPDAVKLADVWFENGAETVEGSDLDFTYRQNYFRKDVNGTTIIANNPHAALSQLGDVVTGAFNDLSDPDEPTGANDGAHRVGLGGTGSQSEWQWSNGDQLNAPNSNVHDAMSKIVQDLASQDNTGHSGIDHVGSSSIAGGSGSGAVFIWPGTLKQTLQTMVNEIARRVQVDGEDRLSGTFRPQSDLGADLGTADYKFNNIYGLYFKGYDIELNADYYWSNEDTVKINLRAGSSVGDYPVWSILAYYNTSYKELTFNFQDPNGIQFGTFNSKLAVGSNVAGTWNGHTAFYADPNFNGTNGPSYKYVGTKTITRVIDNSSVQFAQPYYGRTYNSYSSTTYSGSRGYMYIDITKELLPGDIIESIEIHWYAYSTSNAISCYFRSYAFNGSQTTHGNVTSSVTGEQVSTINLNYTVEKNRRYYLYFYVSQANCRVYEVRLTIRRPSIDGDYS